MKNTLKFILFILPLSILSLSVSAQKNTEKGVTITYAFDMSAAGDLQGMEAFMPTEMVMQSKGNMSKVIIDVPGTMSNVIISDNATESSTILMDMFGNKIMMKQSLKDLTDKQKADIGKIEIEETKETAMIAGYKCKKVLVRMPELEEPMVMFYTPELPFIGSQQNYEFKGIVKGCMMQYEINQNGMIVTLRAKSVSLEPLADNTFAIPEGYEEVNQEDLQKMFGGN